MAGAPRLRPKDTFMPPLEPNVRMRFYRDGFSVNLIRRASLPKRRHRSRELRLRACLWLTHGGWLTCVSLWTHAGLSADRIWLSRVNINVRLSQMRTLWILQHLFVASPLALCSYFHFYPLCKALPSQGEPEEKSCVCNFIFNLCLGSEASQSVAWMLRS